MAEAISPTDLRCGFCAEPWVASEHPLTIGGIEVNARPNCDCLWEAHPDVQAAFVVHARRKAAYPVEGLAEHHKPPLTAQEKRRIEDRKWEDELKADLARRQAELEKTFQSAGLGHILERQG